MQGQYTPEQVARFWPKVDQSGGPTACWPWSASLMSRGYGQMNAGHGRRRPLLAHRVAYELAHGPIPAGAYVLHRCDNPACCNPAHLFTGTQRDNIHDMMRKGRGPKMPTPAPGRPARAVKLTDAQVIEIRRLNPRGQAQIALAAELGISPRTIRDILTRQTWRHL